MHAARVARARGYDPTASKRSRNVSSFVLLNFTLIILNLELANLQLACRIELTKVARKRTCVISDSSARSVRSRARTRCVHGIASRKAESDSSARSVRSRCILCYCTGRTTRSTLNITMNITDTIIIYLIWRSSRLTAGAAWEPAVGTKFSTI